MRDVHKRHVADDAVEAPIREGFQILRVTLHIHNPARIGGFMLARVVQHLRRHVDTRHLGAKACQQSRILALPARQRKHLLPRDLTDQLRENRVYQPESLGVERVAVLFRDLVVRGPRGVGHGPLHIKQPAAAPSAGRASCRPDIQIRVATMATLDVRSSSLKCSLAERFRSTMRSGLTSANWRERCSESTRWVSLLRAQYRPLNLAVRETRDGAEPGTPTSSISRCRDRRAGRKKASGGTTRRRRRAT